MDYTMDVFIEHRVVKEKTGLDKLKIAGITVVGFIVFSFLFALSVIFQSFSIVIIAVDMGIAYLWWTLVTSFNLEFEYALTNGELDVDKIISKRKRKRLITIDLRNVEIFAPVNSPDHKREFENPNFKTKIDASSSPTSPQAYFMTFTTQKTGFTRLIIEPNQKILDGAVKVAPRKVFLK